GPNRLPEPAPRGPWVRLAGQFRNVLVQVLIVAGVVTAALGHPVDAAVILAVLAINAVVGMVQEGRAEQAMAGLRNLLAPRATVLRDGRRRTVAGADLVPGDLVLLEPGDLVPADLRLVSAQALSLQEAVLTGESVPVDKDPAPVAAAAPLGDRQGMLWSGTRVMQGTGRGLVTATGSATELGRIGGLVAAVEPLTTPLVRRMDRFAALLARAILLVSALILAWGLYRGQSFDDLFLAVVGLAVAAIPEGLPAVMTIALAVGAQAMARRHAIVRRLPAIEAVGAVQVICTDKTGTLTLNDMAVAAGTTPAGDFGVAPDGAVAGGGDLGPLARAAALCNDAELHDGPDGPRVEGDPLEGALLAFARQAAPGAGQGWTRRATVPFDSRSRRMEVLVQSPEGRLLRLVKGAPEAVLPLAPGAAAWLDRARALAARGLRVLALAEAEAPEGAPGPWRVLGLVGLMDPPRSEAVAAVAQVRAAGIAVKMITGDHALTAQAIAAAAGLARPDRVLTGAELDTMSDDDLARAVLDTDVFARTAPEHKMRLIAALQGHGLSVAMTGDGVNDAPALKAADVGIAMGRRGSEAAKDASDLVLADDNFASLAAAVREGRRVADNLRKVIVFTLATSMGEALTLAVALVFGLSLPVTAVQILWINLVTEVTLGLALAFDPPGRGAMTRPPRPPGAPVLTRGLVWHAGLVSLLFLALVFGLYAEALARGLTVPAARTLALNALALLEILHLLFIRNLNGDPPDGPIRAAPVVWGMIGAVLAAQAAITWAPPLQAVFGTAALGWVDLGRLAVAGAAFLAVLAAERAVRHRLLG
ncbi:MAG: HAD-IC family P-type ATPase, partial [Rhodobacterales bacterium]|nr:HAD-IC family P-type ATPase [Rhodobacterales bacterium]